MKQYQIFALMAHRLIINSLPFDNSATYVTTQHIVVPTNEQNLGRLTAF
jgi:hypothetical protein